MTPEWMERVAAGLTPDEYMVWTRIQASLWTVADIVIVIYLTRICSLVRALSGRRPHRTPYIVVGLTIPFAFILPVAPSGLSVFRLELLITVPHFLLILFLLLTNLQSAAEALARLLTAAKAGRP